MAVAHADLKPLLRENPGRRFVETLMLVHRPWSSDMMYPPNKYFYDVFEEFPLISSKCRNSQADCFLCLFFNNGNLHLRDAVHIIVEIKGTRDDLRRSCSNAGYFDKYSGNSDYMYLGVPTSLVETACKLIKRKDVGIFDIERGCVLKLAERQPVANDVRFSNMYTMQAYYSNAKRKERVTGRFPNFLLGLPEPALWFGPRERGDGDELVFKACCSFRMSFLQETERMPEELRLFHLSRQLYR